MSCFTCCGTGNEIEDAKELSQKQDVQAEEEETTTIPNPTPPTKPPRRMSVKASLRASVKELLFMKTKFSFANISFKSDSSKHRYISDEVAKFGKGSISARIFTYDELCELTKNFSSEKLLGEGGFGKVYKGFLMDKNKSVAIKQLDRKGCQGNQEFLVEVLMLSLLDHPNLVNLIGYCAEGTHRLLVYEFMFRGSLEQHLLDLPPNKKALDWKTRMKIAEGAARGLGYLHEEANPPVIYRDFKASNILLNENYHAKLSDFGLAKLGPVGGEGHVLTRVMGTYGYCAPEYAATGQLTTKSDVYSFGVVLLEIITGRRVIDNERPFEEQNLVTWANPMFKDKKKFQLLVDPTLENNLPTKALHQALGIAAMCLQQDDDARPSMTDVVTALEFLSSNDNNRKGGDIKDEGGGGKNC